MHTKTRKFRALILLLTAVAAEAIFSEEQVPPVRHNPWSLIIYRPDNSGQMNDVRCWLRLEDAETGEDVTYSRAKANYAWISRPKKGIAYQKSYYLSGGMAMHLLLKPGKYRISFYTPPEKQNGVTAAGAETPSEWKSNSFLCNTENPAKVIFVNPTVNDNGFYNGGWHISWKAPEYWKFTKGFMTDGDN